MTLQMMQMIKKKVKGTERRREINNEKRKKEREGGGERERNRDELVWGEDGRSWLKSKIHRPSQASRVESAPCALHSPAFFSRWV